MNFKEMLHIRALIHFEISRSKSLDIWNNIYQPIENALVELGWFVKGADLRQQSDTVEVVFADFNCVDDE